MRTVNRLTVILALSISLLMSAGTASAGGIKRWGPEYFTNATVYDQNGKALHFYDDVIKGKIVVISFIFAKCHDLCPLTTARLAEVRHRLGDAVGRDVFFVSITIDPENDTPAILKAYAEPFDIGAGWQFLTGSPEVIKDIRNKLGELSRQKSEHTAEVLLGNDRTGEWGHDSAMSDPTLLVLNINSMDPNWRDKPQQVALATSAATSASVQTPMPKLPGLAMYRKLCLSCHTIGKGDRIGPDLAGVSARRDHDWLVTFISEPEKMRRAQDKTLAELTAKFKGTNMPNLGLSTSDAAELIAYIDDETRVQAAKPAVTGDVGGAKTVAAK